MYTCSLQALIESNKSILFKAKLFYGNTRIWKQVSAPPVTLTTLLSIHGQLLAVGGVDSDGKPTSAIHMYNPTTDSWDVISHMGTPRYSCIAAVLPSNQLMVVGGYAGIVSTDSVEFASIE
jgi:N-acetylneuraminic acid mutarotase